MNKLICAGALSTLLLVATNHDASSQQYAVTNSLMAETLSRKDIELANEKISFAEIKLSESLEPRMRFWGEILLNTSDALIFNNETYEIYETIPVSKGPKFSIPFVEERKVLNQKKKIEDVLIANGYMKPWQRKVKYKIGLADLVRDGYEKLSPWFNHVVRSVTGAGASKNIAYLAVVESCFNPDAISEASAAGLFQFIKSTGQSFMIIDNSVDERFDPIKSGESAVIYLRALNARFGSPELAINGYNTGERLIDQALIWALSNSQDKSSQAIFEQIAANYPNQPPYIRGYFVSRASAYVPQFLGVLEYAHTLPPIDQSKELEFDSLKIDYKDKAPVAKKINILSVMQELAISKESFRELNPHILALRKLTKDLPKMYVNSQGRISPYLPNDTTLRVPAGMGEQAYKLLSNYLTENSRPEAHRRTDPLILSKSYTKADESYDMLISKRKEAGYTSVSSQELKIIRDAYLQELLSEPEITGRRSIEFSLRVINRDLKTRIFEENTHYDKVLKSYEGKVQAEQKRQMMAANAKPKKND